MRNLLKNKKEIVKESQKSFSVKEVLSVFIALVALFISIFTLYLNNFRVVDRAFARIVEIGFDDYVAPGGGESVIYREHIKVKDIVVRVAFMNTGNRPAIISKVSFSIDSGKDSMFSDAKYSGDIFPFLLAPHDLKLISLHLTIKDILAFYPLMKWEPFVGREQGKSDYRFLIGLKYLSIDSGGGVHEVKVAKQFFANLKEKAWFSIGMKDRDSRDFPLTPLFAAQTQE